MLITDPDRIQTHRIVKGYSLRLTAKKCGTNSQGGAMCSHTAIRNWETGFTSTIPGETAFRLALVLDLPMASVFRPDDGFVLPGASTGACADDLRKSA